MYCFRRWVHNEGDEPGFTQPQMVQAIEQRPTVREGYLKHLLQLGKITSADADEIARLRQETLERELSLARRDDYVHKPGTLESMWQAYMGQEECFVEDVPTGVDREQLTHYLERLTAVPDNFHLHPKLRRVMNQRRAMSAGSSPLDWATAELLALASVAAEGYRVRLSGQDSQRGTFSQRHAVLHGKREGGVLGAAELQTLARGMADGSLGDAQVAAFAMAVVFRGMTPGECAAFTLAMRDTGEVFDWSGESLPGPVLDKHSTGDASAISYRSPSARCSLPAARGCR